MFKISHLVVAVAIMVAIYLCYSFFCGSGSSGKDNNNLPSTKNGLGEAGKLTISMLAIGHGDTILLQDGHQNVLIDTGHADNKQLVLEKLKALNVKKINTIIITHHHADHLGNVFAVAKNFKVEEIHDNGLVKLENSTSRKLAKALQEGEYRNKRLQAGDRLTLGDNYYLDILSPGDFLTKEQREHLNNNSIVMKLHYKDFTMLLAADIEASTEASLVQKYGNALQADVLKVPHHGIKTSSTEEFIKTVQPKYALITCNDPSHEHPNKSIAKRYKKLGIKIYSNREQGDCVLVTDGKQLEFPSLKK